MTANSACSARFDPYADRTARDLRNRLSTAFILAIEAGDFTGLEVESRQLCPSAAASCYHDFLRSRMKAYRCVFDKIRKDHIEEPVYRAIVLWNAGLFFEVHEILETIWPHAQGNRRRALKGMIQAAGVYVHRRRGAAEAAARLASRSAAHLKATRNALPEIANLENLVERLQDPQSPPPRLFSAA